MRIRSLRLAPFAGFRERDFELTPGLNVVLGPNEAGKSTMFRALSLALLQTTALTPARFDEKIGPYLPLAGGDTIRVSLSFESDGVYGLFKEWRRSAKQGATRLVTPDGAELSETRNAESRLASLLPAEPATVEKVLLTPQTSISRTVRELTAAVEVRRSLGDILRRVLMETGGVSVEAFRDALRARLDACFAKWDEAAEYPEKNRGINNPYTKGKGDIVTAFYEQEGLRLRLQETQAHEEALSRVNERIAELREGAEQASTFVDDHRGLLPQLRRRQEYVTELDHIERESEELRRLNREWPATIDRLTELEKELPELRARSEKLRSELAESQRARENAELLQKVARLSKLKERAEELRAELEGIPAVGEEKLRGLEATDREGRTAQAALEAAELSLRVEAESATQVELDSGGERGVVALGPASPIERKLGGKFSLQYEGLRITVRSGADDVDAVIERRNAARRKIAEELTALGLSSLEEARFAGRRYAEKAAELRHAEQELAAELGEAGPEELRRLEQRAREGTPSAAPRAPEEIAAEEADLRHELSSREAELAEGRSRLEDWKARYKSHDGVIDRLADVRGRERQIQSELEELPKLPEGQTSVAELERALNAAEEKLREIEVELQAHREERARLEASAPDVTSSELEDRLARAEAGFFRVREEGRALRRIEARFEKLLEEGPSSPYAEFERSFRSYLEECSGGRFSGARMGEGIPEKLAVGDGAEIPVPLLSGGTRDLTALALRLAMGDYFLADRQGFLILDDPLVEMDPERQKRACGLISRYAKRHQVLMFTCHPTIADLAGGRRLDLSGVLNGRE